MADVGEGVPDPGLAAGALAALPDPVFILSAVRGADGAIVDLRYEYVNESAACLYGLSVEAVLGRGFCELFPCVRDLGIFASYVQVVESGVPASFEAPPFLESGLEGSFWRTAVRFGDGILVSVHDISGQRRAESVLAEVSRRYQLLAENASDFVVQTTPEGVLTWVSPSVTAVLGWVPQEIVGRNWFDFIDPELVAAVRETAARAAAGEPVFGRTWLRCVDGSYRWVSRTWLPIADDSGAVIALVAGFRDIQAEVETEAALAASENRFRLLAENASDVVFQLSPDGVYTWVSPSVTAVLGWKPEDVIGRTRSDFAHPDDLAALRKIHAGVRPGERVVGRIRLRRADGSYRWMSRTWHPITDDSGAVVAEVASARDVEAEQALAASEQRYQLLAENASDFVVQTTPEGVLAWVSPSVTAVLGWEPAEVVGHNGLDFVHPDQLAAAREAISRILATGESASDRTRLRCADGSYRWVSRTWRPLADDSGTVIALVSGFRDVQSEVAAEHALAKSEEQYRLLAENASDVVMRLSLSRTFEWVSDPVTEILGWRPADLVGRAIDEFIHPDDLARFRQVVAHAPGSASNIEFRFRCVDGTYQWVACRTCAKVDRDGSPVAVVGAMVDITDRKAAEAELTFSASHDPLTGLANRTKLVDEADRALTAGQRSGRTTALLMVDLDHFKNINDALGHSVGDELLRAVAERIAASVRSVDLVARHGGDEFVVLLRDLDDPSHALRLAERLVVESRAPVTVGGTDLYATASVGIASAVPGVDPVRGAVDLIREADTAMYAAKLAGRDRVAQFTDDLRCTADDRMCLENDLRHALARDELAVWYQPEIDLHDGTVRAAEALLRWHHPTGHLRVAAEFINVAEDSGLLLDMGAWVLAQACTDAARWATEDPLRRMVLRVNLSPLELSGSELLATLDEALRASRLDPSLLCVEITETTMLSHNSTVRANLEGIRARGIELAIDDFGTGYGSLTYLRRYPIDVVKIDRSFVTNITTDANDHQLVAGIVALADRLQISVTAEGIETSDQAQLLSTLGCAGAQGFLYAPALPIEQLAEFMQRRPNAGWEPAQRAGNVLTSELVGVDTALAEAINAHRMWTAQLANAIAAGVGEENVALAARDDNCTLGRWLHSFTPTADDRARHQTCNRLHAAFHEEAAKTLRLVTAGQRIQADAAIAPNGSLTRASRALIKEMTDWRQPRS